MICLYMRKTDGSSVFLLFSYVIFLILYKLFLLYFTLYGIHVYMHISVHAMEACNKDYHSLYIIISPARRTITDYINYEPLTPREVLNKTRYIMHSTHMGQWIESLLVQLMACCLFGTNSFQMGFKKMHWNCCQQNFELSAGVNVYISILAITQLSPKLLTAWGIPEMWRYRRCRSKV